MTQNKAVVDIRLRQRCAISPPRSWPICRIACAQKFSEYYFRLPGIVSDPVCCMAFWRLNDPFCSDRDAAVKIAKLFLNGPDNPENCPLPVGGSAPLSYTWFLRPTRVLFQNGISISLAVFAQLTADCPITFQWTTTFSPKNCPFPLGIGSPSNKWYLWPTRVIKVKRHLDRFSRFRMGPECLGCTMHCQSERKPPKLPLPLGIASPRRRSTEPRQ